MGLRELPCPGRGSYLGLVAVLVKLVLDHLLDPAAVRAYYLARREQEAQVLAVILVELAPPEHFRFGRRVCVDRHFVLDMRTVPFVRSTKRVRIST